MFKTCRKYRADFRMRKSMINANGLSVPLLFPPSARSMEADGGLAQLLSNRRDCSLNNINKITRRVIGRSRKISV